MQRRRRVIPSKFGEYAKAFYSIPEITSGLKRRLRKRTTQHPYFFSKMCREKC
jgi:hypothetical protein